MSGKSNVSLRQFSHVAQQNLDGDVRLSREQDGLVNKGTLGQKIATFFFNLGETLGLIGDDRRTERQKNTLEGFSKALKGMYGDDIANQALEQHGVDPDGEVVPLTGRMIRQVIDTAKQARDTEIQTGRETSVKQEVYQQVLDDLHQDLKPKVIKELEEQRREPTDRAIEQKLEAFDQELARRVQDRCRLESDLFRKELSHDDVRYFARQEAETILSVQKNGNPFGVRICELDLKDQSKELFTGENKERGLERFVKNMKRLEELGGMSNVDTKLFAQATLARELSELIRDGDESTLKELGKVQHSLLQPGSFLMRTYHDESTDIDTRLTIQGLVGAMARVMAPVTDSVEGDIRRITREPEPN